MITAQCIRRGTFSSGRDLIRRIDTYIQGYNQQARPFTWTYGRAEANPRAPFFPSRHWSERVRISFVVLLPLQTILRPLGDSDFLRRAFPPLMQVGLAPTGLFEHTLDDPLGLPLGSFDLLSRKMILV